MHPPTNKSSGLQTTTQTIHTGRAILAGAHIVTNGTNDATLIVYDNTSAAGTIVFKQIVTGADNSIPYTLPDGGIRCDTGIHAVVSGTGAEYILFYR
jgi:hypothetical protein